MRSLAAMPCSPAARRQIVGFARRWHALGCVHALAMEHPSTQAPAHRHRRRHVGIGPAARAGRCLGRLRLRPRRRGRHGARVHGRLRRTAWPSAASRPCATSSRTWSSGSKRPDATEGGARRRARRGRRSRAAAARTAAVRRRQVVRRPHDLAGPGAVAAARRARAGVRRLPAAPGRQAVGRARRSICSRSIADAVPARHPRRTRCAGTAAASAAATGRAVRRWRCSTTPTIRSTSGPAAAATMHRRWRRCFPRWRVGCSARSGMRRASAIAAGACNDRIRICALGRILGGHRRAALDDAAFRGRAIAIGCWSPSAASRRPSRGKPPSSTR